MFSTNDAAASNMIGDGREPNIQTMSTDELWALHEEIASWFCVSRCSRSARTENRLKQLMGGVEAEREFATGRRPYHRRSEVSESGPAVRDLGGTREDAALACCKIEIRQADR
jgi:hypothetical protein